MLVCAGCITPPAILPGGQRVLTLDPERFPAAAEGVELSLETGEVLRGVFVPSDPGAPVVLHLLESSGSITSDHTVLTSGLLTLGFHPGPRAVIAALADRGYASLVVDYGGVGASTGERSPEHLARDASAMWADAVARAGGDPSRVIVRGVSIGTLAAAALIEDGAEPGAVSLLLPVQHDTVVGHFATESYGGLLSTLVTPWFDEVGEADLAAALQRVQAPVVVGVIEDDELLPPDEQAALRALVEAGGHTWFVLPGATEADGQLFGMVLRNHFLATGTARSLQPAEAELLLAVFGDPVARDDRHAAAWGALSHHERRFIPEGSLEHLRFEALARGRLHDDPVTVAALACTNLDLEAAARVLDQARGSLRTWVGERDLDGRIRLLDTGDPDGALPVDLILQRAADERDLPRQPWSSNVAPPTPAELAGLARAIVATPDPSDRDALLLQAVRSSDHVDEVDVLRRVTRVLLKVAGYEDRVVPSADGTIRVQVYAGEGEWTSVALDGPVSRRPMEDGPGARTTPGPVTTPSSPSGGAQSSPSLNPGMAGAWSQTSGQPSRSLSIRSGRSRP